MDGPVDLSFEFRKGVLLLVLLLQNIYRALTFATKLQPYGQGRNCLAAIGVLPWK